MEPGPLRDHAGPKSEAQPLKENAPMSGRAGPGGRA